MITILSNTNCKGPHTINAANVGSTSDLISQKMYRDNRPRSIYQYSNMAPRLSGQNSIFGVVFFVSKSLLGIERQKKLEKFAILTRKPRSHARILIFSIYHTSE